MAPGGGRADMTAGWLNLLPGFVNGRWVIDPFTGVSFGNMGNLRAIDQYVPLTEILTSNGIHLSAESPHTWAVAIHGNNLDYQQYKPHIDSGTVRFVNIDTSNANQNTISWEFYVKTFLSDRLSLESLRGWGEQWVIGDHLSDSEKIEELTRKLKSHLKNNTAQSLPNKFSCVNLDYVKMFCPGGSQYICQALGLTPDKRFHDYWDAVLPFTHSPQSLNVWGVNWDRDQWFPD